MRILKPVLLLLWAVVAVSCGGVATPVSPSSAGIAPQETGPEAHGAVAVGPRTYVVHGTVGPVSESAPPCWADRYPCEVLDFATSQEGPIEVVLEWDGAPRALMVQLYWAGEGLAHEDVAPLNGPSRIVFRRLRMEAAAYRLRVVSREPAHAIPFTLTVTW